MIEIPWENRLYVIERGNPCHMMDGGIRYHGKVKRVILEPKKSPTHVILECGWYRAEPMNLFVRWDIFVPPLDDLLEQAISFIVIGPFDMLCQNNTGRVSYTRRPYALT